MPITPATLAKLARYDTPTICNVIELFDIRPRNRGYMDHRVKCNFPELPPTVGFAATACFRSDAPPTGGDAYGSIGAQLDQFAKLPGPPVVVFQDLDDPPAAAVFGEVMCSTYKAFGSTGLVTNGAGRDLEQVRALRYPVFTGSTICSHGYCHMLHLGLPVRVGSLMVNQGDLLHGDANGVTNIPLEIATEVADVAADFVAAEEIVMNYVKAHGPKSAARYNELRKEFQAVVTGLEKRVRRSSKA
jgi:regulator of RNase E activity RraA